MHRSLRLIAILLLIGLYLTALCAIAHPRVSHAYREYFLDRSRTDWKPIRNGRTPEQGIDFPSAELPNFVDYRYGFSRRDSFGRWTDAAMRPVAGVVFAHPFSGDVCINFKARPATSQWRKPVTVLFGDQQRNVQLDQLGEEDYWLDFAPGTAAKELQFRFSGQIPRESDVNKGNPDNRRLGIRVTYIRLFPGNCEGARQEAQPGPAAQPPE